MTVESAVCATDAVYDGVNADAVEAELAKHPRSGRHGTLAILCSRRARISPSHFLSI